MIQGHRWGVIAILFAAVVWGTTGAAATAAKRDVIVVVAVAVIVDRVGGDLVCCRAPGHPLVVVEVSAKVAQGLAELQQHVRRVTAPYKYPREVEFLLDLPKTISGKILRTELRKREQI